MLPASKLVSRALDGDGSARDIVRAMSAAGAIAFVVGGILSLR
jgi:hypothetical protein